ncbi:type IX secretion system sortase PorU [Dyadobacter sp. MSC1_007]|jgi:hypothetical protein|uniref:type IX secretion system sortase PorU n=1 Tax=Dyadobacter sp. MSC1_007 TaxID=2909264 RepID=UPI00202EB3F5|nr:type IX secretion system sortase PorU [Dyadobacter sp. MSC1_007]
MRWLKRVDVHKKSTQAVFSCLGLLISFFSFGQKSVLSEGQWFKLAITHGGVHRIDAGLLSRMGINVQGVDPTRIQIYGNGGAMLPQANQSGYSNALTENAIWVAGEADGKFDKDDAVYFYAEGPHVIRYDSARAELQHQINYYSDTTYYYLTIDQRPGLRIKSISEIPVSTGKITSYFDDYWFHESETSNTLKSGREWWGEYLGSSAGFSIQVNMPGIMPSSEIKIRTSAIGAAQVPTRFIWQLNGSQFGIDTIGTVSPGTYDVKGLRADATRLVKSGATPPAALNLTVNYDKKGQNSAEAYLNYIGVQARRELRAYEGQQAMYFLPGALDTVTYLFLGSSEGLMLWNITNPLVPSAVTAKDGAFRWTAKGGRKLSQYISFRFENALEPVSWQPVNNQNIAAARAPDLLIVTPAAWQNEANRLAAYRNVHDGLEVLVVTTAQIYNEYASGKPDLTAIRNFTRDLYRKSPGKLKYLLLFGDATYDYRNLLQNQSEIQRNNWVPVYESRESLNPVYTYSSDDYFGFLEAGEGIWNESTVGDHTVDIGIGRLPVKSTTEAKIVVDKLIHYESGASAGIWRNTVRFVADDGDGNIHQRHADQLAKFIQGGLFPVRSFVDEVPQTTTSGGQKAPAINAAIRKSIDDGTLILNYTGHGGVSGWAEEQVLTLADMLSARGMDNLPLLLTATCDFGRYDDPGTVSGAELMVLSPKGAAIGAISTTRPVYASTNFTLNQAFYTALRDAKPGQRLGDFFRETKNNALSGSLNRNFTLLADPSMRLGTGQNGIRWITPPDTLRALQKVSLETEIFDRETGKRDSLFNGTARLMIYDKQVEFRTLGGEGAPENYQEYRSKLFDGNVSVKEGRLKCTLVMPKDIDYRIGLGRVSVYATRSDSTLDAAAQLPVTVGGSAPLGTDKTPPQLSGYLNAPSFRDGDTVEPSSILLLHMSDENGISVSKAGIGHDITATLNDTLTIVLNDYYVADLDDYTSGKVVFPLENLPTGKYVIRLKVWDAYTNFSEIAFGFLVGPAKGIQLNALNVYPNPFERDLSFELSHSRVNEDVELIFNILLANGQQVGTFRKLYYNSEPVIRESLDTLQLTSRLPFYNTLVYQLKIRSLKDNSTDQKAGKLIRSP